MAYYAKGHAVFAEPEGGKMGFLVCECCEFVEGAAEIVAKSLNFVDKVAALHPGHRVMDAEAATAMEDTIKEAKEIAG